MSKTPKKENDYKQLLAILCCIIVGYYFFYRNYGFIGDFGDPIGQTIPNKFLIAEYYKAGFFPLWNPFSFLGFPLIADPQAGAFYFPDVIFFSNLAALDAHNASVIFHIFLGSVGTYYLVKGLVKEKQPAVVAAIIMALASSFLSKVFFLNLLETIVYIPWILYAVTATRHPLTILFFSTCMMLLAGHPVAAFYGTIMLIIFTFLFHYPKIKKILSIAAITIAAYLTCSIQLLPLWELSQLSVRSGLTFEEFIGGKTTLPELLSFIIPTKDWLPHHVDKYLHFGTIAFITLLVSFCVRKRFSKDLRKVYHIGGTFVILGIMLATLGIHPILAKFLYQVPILNLARVSARFIILTHIGAVICIAVFLTYLAKKKPKIASGLSVAIILNSLLVPLFFLDHHQIADGEEQYMPELRTLIEENSEDQFSLTRPPIYFLSSSLIMFPNRHVINKMHNIIGYNPLVTKSFHDTFPVSPVGSFEDPDYFKKYYERFVAVGIKYYLFPTEEYLEELGLEEKSTTIDFLQAKGWTELAQHQNTISIWENPDPLPFVNFLKKENKITSIKFKPGEIELELDMKSPDRLIVRQSCYPGWTLMYDDIAIPATKYQDLVQDYVIPGTPSKVTIVYQPEYYRSTWLLSMIGVSILILHHLLLFRKTKD
jgi:hypothetical protein